MMPFEGEHPRTYMQKKKRKNVLSEYAINNYEFQIE